MSESDKSGKQELTSDDFKRINEWVGEIYYKSPPHTDNWNELQGIAERATLHERSAAQARIAELEALRKTVEMLTSGLPVTNAADVKFMAEQADRIKKLESAIETVLGKVAAVSHPIHRAGDYILDDAVAILKKAINK